MAKQQSLFHNNHYFKIIAVTVVLVIAFTVAIMWLTFAVKNRFYDEAVSQQTSLAEQKQETSMLKFCLQRDIKQCDAESVKKWNETHPGDTFTFHSVQELTEQAIRDVELYSAQRPFGL